MSTTDNLQTYINYIADPRARRSIRTILGKVMDDDFRIDLSGFETKAANTGGCVVSAGTSSSPITNDTADMKFFSIYTDDGATSGDSRALYLRHYITGAGGGGEAARIFTTVSNVAAATAHGAHISLSFGTSGTVTGQGIAVRATLHIPSTALASNVTMSAVQAEIYSDAATSDPGGSTILSFFRVVNGGNATGMADVDDDAVLFDIQGLTAGAAKLLATSLTAATVNAATTASLKCRVGSTTYYLPLATAIT